MPPKDKPDAPKPDAPAENAADQAREDYDPETTEQDANLRSGGDAPLGLTGIVGDRGKDQDTPRKN